MVEGRHIGAGDSAEPRQLEPRESPPPENHVTDALPEREPTSPPLNGVENEGLYARFVETVTCSRPSHSGRTSQRKLGEGGLGRRNSSSLQSYERGQVSISNRGYS